MTLVLEIEYLSGVSFAAKGPDSDIPDWPPQPDRIFSALVSAWAARGENQKEAEALKWLEVLPPPRILASETALRTAPLVFVPPNDPRIDKQTNAKRVLPGMRKRQPRRFPATRPHDPIVRLLWDSVVLKDEILTSLQRLASDTAYIGHSASLTRCRFLLEHDALGRSQAGTSERRVYVGRFDELCSRFRAGRRPFPGTPVAPAAAATRERSSLFGERWLLLEHIAGDMPDIRACALIARTIRHALLSGYQRIGLGDEIPEVVSGHAVDGKPAVSPHLAVVALPFVGFPYADGHVMGFALIPPRDSAILDDEYFRKAMRTLAPMDVERGRRVITLKTKEGTPSDRAFSIDLSPTFEPPADKRSLDPALYLQPSQTFATVTPIALDRHLKEKGGAQREEIAAQIANACRNIGIAEPHEIVADKHSALEGVPSAYPSGKSPDWLRWRLPQSLVTRQLTHAVIRFASPVEGPLILGAGRFMGFGLCRPVDPEAR